MIKKSKDFMIEDAMATASTAGMGAVVTAIPASVPGATVTGNGTSGSGDIGVPFGLPLTKKPANLNNKKKGKKVKEPKKYKFSDMIKFEDFDYKTFNENYYNIKDNMT